MPPLTSRPLARDDVQALGQLYQQWGRADYATDSSQITLQIHRQLDTGSESWAPKYTLTANVLLDIALLQCNRDVGNFNEALSNINEALDLRCAIYGDENARVAVCHSRIGALWSDKLKVLANVGQPGIHDNAQMLTINERTIHTDSTATRRRPESWLKCTGRNLKSPTSAVSLPQLSAYLSCQPTSAAEVKEGVDLITKALRIQRRVWGDDNPTAQSDSKSLEKAQTLLSRDDYQEGRIAGAREGDEPPSTHVSALRATTAAVAEDEVAAEVEVAAVTTPSNAATTEEWEVGE